MYFYLSIDDTDNKTSPGSGQLMEQLAVELENHNLAGELGFISRHQLYVHPLVPYTSHNSAMSFSAETADHMLDDVIIFVQTYLQKHAAPGSDPGLSVAAENNSLDSKSLITFGRKAKKGLISKQEAILLAQKTGVHLLELGGTGDGIIGALAGTGLRITGNDGRIRGWFTLDQPGKILSVKKLLAHPLIESVIDEDSQPLPEDDLVYLGNQKLKTILHKHHRVLPVMTNEDSGQANWRSLTRQEIKMF